MGTPLLVGGPGLQQGQQPIIPGKKNSKKIIKNNRLAFKFYFLQKNFVCYDNEEESDIN